MGAVKYISLIILIGLFVFCFAILVVLFNIFTNTDSTKEGIYYSNSLNDDVIMSRSYFQEFESGSIKSIFFKKLDVNPNSESFKRLDEQGKRNLIDSYPSYYLEFVVINNGFLMNFKNVIFNELDARLYRQHHMVEPDFGSASVAYFQIGRGDVNDKNLGQYPVRVVNVFKIAFNDALFNSLVNQEMLRFTLVSHDDKEYNLKVDNFLSKYDFKTPVWNK
ncbi:hypothetical protein [Borrelia sp. RT1S]|uniref:hypothetical protein n=1 Tax=Borrelia sp. RT1S TaxID=2898580 RepID=UPI001E2F94F3|nr:hypothetical protein [Borrelia sp. RT1S]UGQ17967.1 hypothetical protein LSO05_05905 [Borrelia sp. RT1S]